MTKPQQTLRLIGGPITTLTSFAEGLLSSPMFGLPSPSTVFASASGLAAAQALGFPRWLQTPSGYADSRPNRHWAAFLRIRARSFIAVIRIAITSAPLPQPSDLSLLSAILVTSSFRFAHTGQRCQSYVV